MGSRGHQLTLASRWLGIALLGVSLAAPIAAAQSALPAIKVASDANGLRLQVDGRDVFVKGVNWDYFPIGTNYSYSLWTQDDVIIDALDRESRLRGAPRGESSATRPAVGGFPRA